MKYVSGDDCASAWRAAVAEIAHGIANHNLLVEINNTRVDDAWLSEYNPKRLGPAFDNIKDVVSTIFPVRLRHKAANRQELYRKYAAVYSRGKTLKRNRGAWGTYFNRLISFGNGTNQLEDAILKLKNWSRVEAALTFHLTAPNIDRPRRLGGPCWHFGELLWRKDNSLDFVVVYRNHDYFNKALGNFIGLSSLLNFICDETNLRPGRLICHSVHVYQSTSVSMLKRLAKQ